MAKPKLLLLSFYFPPFNVAGSLRLGKFAKYLEQSGFDVRVITADKQADTQTIPLEIDKDKVIYASWNDVNALPKKFMGGSDKAYEVTQVDKTFLSPKKRFFLFLSNMYKTLTNYPDSRVGWVKGANKAANELFKTWKPDIIYASSLPASVAVAAYKMHKKHTIPWVCEYRDLWTLNHYYYYPDWRRFFEKRLEKRIVKSAEFTVTVSNGLAGQLKDDFGVNAQNRI